MILRKFVAAAALSAALVLPLAAPAAAQSIAAGARVTDAQGGEVGTITAVDGDHVVLRTDRHEARLPVSAFAATENAVLFGITRDQLNGQIDPIMAQAQQAVTVGAVVHDREGAVVGPVEAIEGENLIVKLGEQRFQLPRAAVAPGPNGLVIGVTLTEIQAQLGGSAGAGSD